MPLTDALFLDPSPVHKWLARRADGLAGTGTLDDPLTKLLKAESQPQCGSAQVYMTRILIQFAIASTAVSLALFYQTPDCAAAPAEIVVPNALANTEGNSQDGYPFMDFVNTVRYQEIFDSSQFSAIAHGGAMIIGMNLRSDSGSGILGASTTLPSLQIDLSTSLKAPDGLSTVFSENVGHDNTMVFGPGPLTLSDFPFTIPHPFSVAVQFSTAFFYNPGAGNLLIDIRNYAGTTVERGTYDAQDSFGDSISRVYAAGTLPTSGVNALSGTADSKGLIVDFVVTPVPEPSALVFVLLGSLPMGFWLMQTKSKQGRMP